MKTLKIATWNVCGLRALLKKDGLSHLITAEDPDIICLNETMLQTKNIPQVTPLLPQPYIQYFSCSVARKGYSGVSILTKAKPIEVTEGLGIPKHDLEGRTLVAEYPNFYIVSTYVPNAGAGCCRLDYRTLEWDVDLRSFLSDLQEKKPVIWCGDLNVVHLDIDIYDIRGKETYACCTPQERSAFSRTLAETGMIDTFRHKNPGVKDWSYFSRRNVGARAKGQGWRLDYCVVSRELENTIERAYIRPDIDGSDHHPCLLVLNQSSH